MINFESDQDVGAPLTRERIVTEAVSLLDEVGIARLTMRKLADRLDHGPTTLYWHVDTKNDVLDLALDAILADIAEPPHGTWRDETAALLRAWRAAALRHTWCAELLPRPMFGPNALSWTESLHHTLRRAGFEAQRLTTLAHSLVGYVTGATLAQARWHLPNGARDPENQREHYPTLAAQGYFGDHDWDAAFEEGLGHLLDGIEREAAQTS